jgi:lipid-A-disaccharide synthase-like uncharacterized protein
MRRLHLGLLAAGALLVCAVTLGILVLYRMPVPGPGESVNVKVQLEGYRDHANLILTDEGEVLYQLMKLDGAIDRFTPQEYAELLLRQQSSRSLLAVVFNISSPYGIAWVCLGLLGQLLFTGRMLVQWLVSEKSRRSVVPPAFWWLSTIGGMMLLSYFLWRRDVVGVLGQAFGVAIYLRNIVLIYRPATSGPARDAAAPPAEANA